MSCSHLCSILNNAPNLFRTRNTHRDDFTRRNFDRLNAVETEVAPLLFDLRGIKEEAAQAIKRLRWHPPLAIWARNNEGRQISDEGLHHGMNMSEE